MCGEQMVSILDIKDHIYTTCLTVYTVSMQDLEGLCDCIPTHDIIHEVIIVTYMIVSTPVCLSYACVRGICPSENNCVCACGHTCKTMNDSWMLAILAT